MTCVKYLLFVFNLLFAVSMWKYIAYCIDWTNLMWLAYKTLTVFLVMYLIFIFQISGIAILTVGALMQNFYSNYTDFLHGNFYVAPLLLIILGVIVFVVAFFGCCGAVKENLCMIMTVSWLAFVYFLYLDNIF